MASLKTDLDGNCCCLKLLWMENHFFTISKIQSVSFTAVHLNNDENAGELLRVRASVLPTSQATTIVATELASPLSDILVPNVRSVRFAN